MTDRTWRLSPTDEMLHGSASALGSARVIQLLWRFPQPVSGEALEAEWRRLDGGRLSREAAAARVYGARRKWVAAANAEPLHVSPQPLAEAAAADWIDEQVRVPLPAGSGKLWRLAVASCAGGTLVSLTVPHFRCDGLGLFAAIGARASVPPPRRSPFAVARDSDPGDAAAQISGALAGLARTLASPARRRQLRSAISGMTGAAAPAAGATGTRPRFFTSVIVDIDARSWEERAAAAGGTVNSLFVQVATNLVRARVQRDPGIGIDVGIPVNLRGSAGDGRANALVVVPLAVPGAAVNHEDLRPVRLATKELLRDTGWHTATLVPEPLWHRMPAGWAGALKAPGAQQADVVASNFGTVPEAVTRFAGCEGTVALRTMNVPGLVPERARLRASLVLLQADDQMTMTVTGMPDYFGDSASLSRLVEDELAAWGLSGRPWWEQACRDGNRGAVSLHGKE